MARSRDTEGVVEDVRKEEKIAIDKITKGGKRVGQHTYVTVQRLIRCRLFLWRSLVPGRSDDEGGKSDRVELVFDESRALI